MSCDGVLSRGQLPTDNAYCSLLVVVSAGNMKGALRTPLSIDMTIHVPYIGVGSVVGAIILIVDIWAIL